MKSFWDISIKSKLVTIIMATTGAAIVLACAAFMVTDYAGFRKETVEGVAILGRAIGHNVQSAILFGDSESAEKDLSALSADKQVLSACIYLPDGSVFAAYRKNTAGEVRLKSPLNRDGHFFEGNFLHTFHQLKADEEVLGELYIQFDLSEIQAKMVGQAGLGFLVMLICFLMAYVLSSVSQRVISRPVQKLAEMASRISREKDYSLRAIKQHQDELGVLTDNFNEMLIQIEIRDLELRKIRDELEIRVEERTKELKIAQAQAVQGEKMTAVGQLAGGIAHDFNNLMTAIMGYAELLHKNTDSGDPRSKDIDEILTAGKRATKLTNQLLSFSRRQMIQAKVIRINEFLSAREKTMRAPLSPKVEFVMHLAPEAGVVNMDEVQLQESLMHLVTNAAEAMPHGGRVIVETGNTDLDQMYTEQHEDVKTGPYVMIAVTDTGVGMTKEVQSHLFEPFFTTKSKEKGAGLGLATTYGNVRQAGGCIFIYSEPRLGTTVKMYLPRAVEKETAARPAEPMVPSALSTTAETKPPKKAVETILFAEDEPMVRNLSARVLRSQGYTVLEASNGDEAMRVSTLNHDREIHLLVTDIVMPQVGGKELADKLKVIRPGMKLLFISGYTDETIIRQGILDRKIPFLQKPFSPNALTQKIREILDQPGV